MSPRPDTAVAARRSLRRPLLTALGTAAGPTARTVCAVHPGALPPTIWQDLVARLPEDSAPHLCDLGNVPAYAMAALDPTAPVPGVRELAAQCLAELTAAGLTERQLTLIGWSFGGVVAYEIAAQLAAEGRGDVVDALVVLDSIAPVAAFQPADDALRPTLLLDWFAMYLGAKRGRRFDFVPTDEDDLGTLLDAATAQGLLPADTEEAGLRKLFTAFHAGLVRNNRCTAGYLPDPLDRTITLVKPAGSLLPASPDLGWAGLSGRPLHKLTVPGDHYTLLGEPETVAALAALLAAPPTGTRQAD
ncbi:thioesterase domain-containing protein [Streptomyces pseudovenezuelae]|uniref:Thioesterase domain-containing protein n=1 Tax=Streptomyces pseudovenezuelae TaxID=67350 RepID=A0ABT6LKM2_9ACTN|nr:thioesterase domain-containing protein [Streptomyces pseudovenezuelae]MDH6216861.1 thioesterase domain-containing protein [Streptomyces pseudovenezuelae]